MPAKINLIGQKFGKLTVLEETSERRNNSVVWKCKCDCGNLINYSTKQLRSDGLIQCPQCGHKREPKKVEKEEDIIGQKFNHLTVLCKGEKQDNDKKYLYKCQCDCEAKTICYVRKSDLKRNHKTSCGCARIKYKIGDIVNNKKIIDYVGNINNHFYYKCKCLLCNNEYNITCSNIEKTFSCGCIKSKGEFIISNILNENNISFLTQYRFNNSLLRYDFALLNKNNEVIRLIEFDGEQHFVNNIKKGGWNNLEHFLYTNQHDNEKNKLAKENNIPLIRIPYWERDNISLEMLLGNRYLV